MFYLRIGTESAWVWALAWVGMKNIMSKRYKIENQHDRRLNGIIANAESYLDGK